MLRNRSPGVTLLLWVVLSLSAWGAVRLTAALRWWTVLVEFEARPGPQYLAITGAGWLAAGVVLLWSLFQGKGWTRWAMPAFTALWILQYWIERLFFQAPRANSLFALTGTIVLFIAAFVSALHPKTRTFYTRSEEHEQPDEYSDSA